MENTKPPTKFIISVEHLEALFNCILEARHKYWFPEDIRGFLANIRSKLVPHEDKESTNGPLD